MSRQRFTAGLFGGFAAIALLLAAVGIYGVMSFAVAQRTHEIGLRMALGAGQGNVLALILKEGMILAGVGLALGLFGAYGVGQSHARSACTTSPCLILRPSGAVADGSAARGAAGLLHPGTSRDAGGPHASPAPRVKIPRRAAVNHASAAILAIRRIVA